jgi:hypothetical protein
MAYALAMTEVAKACGSTSVTMAVSNMVADAISAWGREDQALDHVPRIASAEYLAGAFALSEPGAGSDAGSLQTRAERRGAAYQLTGNKCWITSGDRAGIILVMAKTDPSAGSRGISTFLVRPGTDGLSVGRHEDKLGLRASSTVTLELDGVTVPEADRLGDEGVGFKVAMRALDGGRIGVAAQALGIAEGAVAEASRCLGERIPRSWTDRWRALEVDLESARLLVLRAAELKERALPFGRSASMAKLYTTEIANSVCHRVHAMMLEAGLEPTARIQRAVRDVRVTTIYEGTSEIQRLVIARSVMQGVAA